jgi:hypothetical protein
MILSTAITVLALIAPSAGQDPKDKPNFTGTWALDAARSVSAQSEDPAGPVTLVIKQTDSELSIETRRGERSETLVYNLDGSETKKPPQDNGPFAWRARWKGPKLVTETHRSVNRTTVSLEEVLSLNAKQTELIVDRTLTVQHGYMMRGAKNYSSGQDVFTKVRAEGK